MSTDCLGPSKPRRVFLSALAGFAVISLLSRNSPAGEFKLKATSDHSWPRNLVRALQQRLSERGFDAGPADGLEGPKTASAIRAFQTSTGMEPDGHITNELLIALQLSR